MAVTDECWIVQGTDSRGGFWMTRLRPGFDGIKSLAEAESGARRKAERMNSLGANVNVYHQKIDGITWKTVQ